MWLHVLTIANKALEQIKISSLNNDILLTILITIQIDLENALSKNMDPFDAFGVAVKAAENFNTNVLHTQSFHVNKNEILYCFINLMIYIYIFFYY